MNQTSECLGLYRSSKIEIFNGRPVQKVEVVAHNADFVTFKTDYPVEIIVIPRRDFDSMFSKW